MRLLLQLNTLPLKQKILVCALAYISGIALGFVIDP